jgi:hypothetical protein
MGSLLVREHSKTVFEWRRTHIIILLMDLPDIYDLLHFNKKTHNIVVSIKYNMIYNHLEITYDGVSIITNEFYLDEKYNAINYDFKKSSIIIDLIHKNFVGLYRDYRSSSVWKNIYDYDTAMLSSHEINIYFHKTTIPPFFLSSISSYSCITPFSQFVINYSRPFIIFSNDIIEPVPYFDITKMKYIKQYIVDVMVNCKLVYIVYKLYNIIFTYNSHIIYNDIKLVFTSWNDKQKKFYCDFNIVPQELYESWREIDFAPIVGDYKNTLIYRYC